MVSKDINKMLFNQLVEYTLYILSIFVCLQAHLSIQLRREVGEREEIQESITGKNYDGRNGIG